jgi:hypothetical protein
VGDDRHGMPYRDRQLPEEAEFVAMGERLQTMRTAVASTTARVQVFPTRVDGSHTEKSSAEHLVALIREDGLLQATMVEAGPVLGGEGWPNELHVLWNFARAAREYARENRTGDQYALFADYWFAPDGRVWAVHFVICDHAGEWVIVDLQNNHQEDFQRIDPKTTEDCDRLVSVRLEQHLD